MTDAIPARRAEIAGQPRPQPLDTARDVRAEIEAARERDATWRLYVREWVCVYTSTASGTEGQDECRELFEKTYRGRVLDSEWRVVQGSHALFAWLELFLPNLAGEFRDWAAADELSDELAEVNSPAALSVFIVQRGTREERELLDYGRRRLPAGANTGK